MNRLALVVLAVLNLELGTGNGGSEFTVQSSEFGAAASGAQNPTAAAADWPQWRGPRRDGSVAAALPTQWPDALKKRWEVTVGGGHASPVVSGNRVVVIAREGDQEIVRALEVL